MTAFLTEGPADADTTLLLAPGAGAPKTSPWMGRASALLAEAGLRVARFDFAYMAARQKSGTRRPPPRAEALVAEYEAAVDALSAGRPAGQRLVIGGKSLGGRVASLAAQALFERGRIAGLVCLGYPFHPPNRPEQLRTRHLTTLTCPTLIVQGERDPFGGPPEVSGYGLSPAIAVHWATYGDHDLAPRRSSGATLEGNLAEAVGAIVRFVDALA
ncbi:alpha/beta family hydrolase [Hyphomicrobium sp.]|uniref:alpha/beta family hydrolase n=1 Tax=Hyphomicrobium sp. TaxID=82 RepID=UPI0025BE0772|nr:alpha/beta family hydrolase [Hyphomicrobium sp.]MCC7251952.1 alpha/beta hydrolase [Hyphomicrobium sp.]